MKKFLFVLMTLFFSIQSAMASGVDAFMDKHVAPVSDAVARVIFYPVNICNNEVPLIIFWILIAGIFFTIYYRGISVWGFKHAVDMVAAPGHKHGGNDSNGEVSSFQALATALSGTIGIGSIAGVAISISIGGPGAAFWIFAGALLGMSIKFVEASLAVKYRRFNLDGSVSGGPMHYIAHGFSFFHKPAEMPDFIYKPVSLRVGIAFFKPSGIFVTFPLPSGLSFSSRKVFLWD